MEQAAGNSAVYVAKNAAQDVAADVLEDAASRVDASVAGEPREYESNAEEISAGVDGAFTDESIPSIEAQQQLEQ